MSGTSDSPAPRPHVLVLGRGKTGTTFIAKSIEAACPVPPVRFVMEPRSRRVIDAASDASATATVVMKTLFGHWRKKAGRLEALVEGRFGPAFHARIAIVRDPRDELISRLMFRPHGFLWRDKAGPREVEAWARVLEAREADPTMTFLEVCRRFREVFGIDTLKTLRQLGRRGVDYADFLAAHQSRLVVLRYEDAVADDFSSVEPALGWPVATTSALGGFGQTRRSRAANNWMKWFQPSDLDLVRDELGGVCRRLGYDDWTIPGDLDRRIDPEHHSAYARSLVRDYRRKGGALRKFARRLKNKLTP